MIVPMHDSGSLMMHKLKVADKGSPFATHSYCSSGQCPTLDVTATQD